MSFYKSVILTVFLCVLGMQMQAQDSEYNLDETYSIDKNGTIYLQSNDAEVTIQGSDRSDVHLVVYRYVDVDGWEIKSEDKFEMKVDNRNGDLYIREADRNNGRFVVGNVQEEYRINIEAPRDVALDINGDDDSYEISDFNSAIKLDADDTDIELSGMNGESFEFDIDDGSINMEEGQGSLKLDFDDGEFYVRRADFTEIDVSADDAGMDISTSLSDDGFYRFDMDDGDLELNIAGGGGEFDIRHDDSDLRIGDEFEEVSSDEDQSIYRLAGGDARIEIDTDDGDIELRTI